MSRIATSEALRGNIVPIDIFLERLNAVSIDDVNSVISDVYGGGVITSLVGPAEALASCGC
jgi:hypothetical protein